MSTVKDLGMVTAYAYAVSKGYTGTEEEFATLMASYATVAEAAAASASAAADSATAASGSAGTASTKASEAAASASAASGSASTASTKAGEAASSASAAAGSASTASTKAGEAASSASAAAGSASTASTKAGEASTSATNAATAKTAAQAAQTAAETAQGKAEDAQEAAEAAAEQAEATLSSYAKVDGSYSSMTVGNAEQLVATVAVEDSVPYNFRTSGGTADIGDREVDKLVGGTVAWNQMFNYDSFTPTTQSDVASSKSNNKLTFNGTASAVAKFNLVSNNSFTFGHKYLIVGFGTGGSTSTYYWNFNVSGSNFTRDTVVAPSENMRGNLNFAVASGASVNITFTPQIFDLTQMFGTTIADYIYSLETATPGAGVAWFRKLFPKPYYAYNPGELMSVQAAAHKMVGFNAFDTTLERIKGTYNASVGGTLQHIAPTATCTGDNPLIISVPTAWYCMTFVSGPLVKGQQYQLTHKATFTTPSTGKRCTYLIDKDYVVHAVLSTTGSNPATEQALTFTPAEDGLRVAMYFANGAGGNTITIENLCLHLKWDGERDGEYEPYVEYTYPLDDSLTLRGIPKLDSGNALYYDGDTYESDGTVTRRYGVVDLGTLTWEKLANNPDFLARSGIASAQDSAYGVNTKFICSKYVPQTQVWNQMPNYDKCVGIFGTQIRVEDSAYETAAAFKTAMSGVMLVYELATPTTETADPFQSPQIVDDFGTEEYVDAAVAAETRDVSVPVGHDTLYQANLRAKLEMAPDSPDGDGDYIVRQTNGTNAYVPLMKELPTAPTTAGTYHLKATVTSGGVTLTWEADT